MSNVDGCFVTVSNNKVYYTTKARRNIKVKREKWITKIAIKIYDYTILLCIFQA